MSSVIEVILKEFNILLAGCLRRIIYLATFSFVKLQFGLIDLFIFFE